MTDEERILEQDKTDNWYRNEYLKSEHWRTIAKKRMEIDKGLCQMCGSRGTSGNPLQVHHWGYKNLWHEDVETQLITLCDCCHLQTHRLLMRPTSADGSSNRIKNPQVPNVHVFTINGERIEHQLDDLGRQNAL